MNKEKFAYREINTGESSFKNYFVLPKIFIIFKMAHFRSLGKVILFFPYILYWIKPLLEERGMCV